MLILCSETLTYSEWKSGFLQWPPSLCSDVVAFPPWTSHSHPLQEHWLLFVPLDVLLPQGLCTGRFFSTQNVSPLMAIWFLPSYPPRFCLNITFSWRLSWPLISEVQMFLFCLLSVSPAREEVSLHVSRHPEQYQDEGCSTHFCWISD